MYVLFGVVIALYVLALALWLYPWHDKPKQQRSRLAASVALGAAFGLEESSRPVDRRCSGVAGLWQ
jgi:hypothetical protein